MDQHTTQPWWAQLSRGVVYRNPASLLFGLDLAQSRVETWRGGFRQSISVVDPFGCRCLISSAMLRFHVPLIKPDMRIYRIRLSDKVSCFRPREIAPAPQ